MKKVLCISAIALLSLSSCKKDYTCECSTSFFGVTVSVTTEAKSSKKGAEEWCKSMQSPMSTTNGTTTSGSIALTCAIK